MSPNPQPVTGVRTPVTFFGALGSVLIAVGLAAGFASPAHASNIMLVSDLGTFSVSEFDATSGAFIQPLSLPAGVGTGFGTGFNLPAGVAFGPNGAAYVADSDWLTNNGLIYEFDAATGAYVSTFITSSNISNPAGMTFGPNGDLYVANYGNGGVGFISAFDSSGNYLYQFGSTPVGATFLGLYSPQDVAFGLDGNLYVSDGSNGVSEFAPDGTFLGVFVPLGSGPGRPAGLANPWGLAFDSAGNLYVADIGGSVVDQFSAAGTFLGQYVTSASILTQPTDIAFGPDHNLYVANSGAVAQVLGPDNAVPFVSYPDVTSPQFLAFSGTAPVPEPATFMLFGLGGIALAILRRRHRGAASAA